MTPTGLHNGPATAGPLAGLQVAVAHGPRALLAAAAWLAELGATVSLFGDPAGESPAPTDQAWLTARLVAPNGTAPDLVLVAGDDDGGPPAPTRVRLFGAAPDGPLGGRQLDEAQLAALTGVAIAIGEPGRPPLPPPTGILDAMVGVHLAGAALAGMLEDAAVVDVVAADVVASGVMVNASLYEPFGRPWIRAGSRASASGGTYPYGIMPAKDGSVCLVGRTAADWKAMVTAAGRPTLAADPRFADLELAGREHGDELDGLLQPWLSQRTRAEVVADGVRHRFAASAVLEPAEVLADPVTAPLWREVPHGEQTLRVPGSPFEIRQLGRATHRPLSECLVLDLSWVWSGPGMAAGLADLGATVVKVESRTRPDNTRLRSGRRVRQPRPDSPPLEISPYFHAINRGKRSVSLDLTTGAGRKVLADLAARADVIIENLSPGVMDRFGVAPHQVAERNPGCVYVSLRGYRDHPRTRGLRAYAPALSSAAGLEALVAYPGEPPIGMMTYGFSDAHAVGQGLSLALAGLVGRRRRAAGSVATLYQHDGCVWANGHNLVEAQLGGVPEMVPLEDQEIVPFDQLGSSEAVSDDLLRALPHPWLETVDVAALPWRIDRRRPAPKEPGPALGADTRHVLSQRLGLDEASIDTLAASGALT